MHLCGHCNLDPHNNDVFEFVQFVWDCDDKEFSRVLTIEGSGSVTDRRRIVSAARGRILNDRQY